MNFKTTIVLLVIVAGLAGYVWYDSRQPPTVPTASMPKRVFKQFSPDDATRIAIARGAGLKDQLVLVKTVVPPAKGETNETKVWKLEKPVADAADDVNVGRILEKVQLLEADQKLEGEQAKKALFGASPVLTLTVSRPADKGGDVTIEIGQKLAADTVFLRVVGRNDVVYLVKKDTQDLLEKPAFEFRSKQLFSIAGIDVDKLSIKVQEEQGPAAQPRLTEIVKGKDHFWRLGGEGGDLLDTKKVDDLVPKIRDLKPQDVASDAPSPADLESWGLAKPQVELTLLQEIKDQPPKTETLALGAKVGSSELRHAQISGRPFVYKVDASALLPELRKDPNSYRTDTLILLHSGTDGLTALDAKWKARELKLKKGEKEWTIEVPSKTPGDETAIKALLKQIGDLKVATREGDDAVKSLDKYGLAEPVLVLTLEEGPIPRGLQIGYPVQEKEGFFYVRREGEARVLTSKLGDLQQKLETGSRTLRSKVLMKASHWEAVAVKLLDKDGKPELEAVRKDGKWQLVSDATADVNEKLGKFLETFDELKAIEIVAEADPELVTAFGLEKGKARKLVIKTESWDSDAGAKKPVEKALLIGRRDGDQVYAMEEGGTAVARIDAEFLERLGRGFLKEKEIFTVDAFSAVSVIVKDGDREVLHLEKKKDGPSPTAEQEWFLGDRKLVRADVEKTIELFAKVEASKVEEATDAKKKERGLSPATRSIQIHAKRGWGDKPEETKTLLLGARGSGEHDVYAMDEGGTELGSIYDYPLRKLNELMEKPPYAPVSTDGTAKVGSADVAPVTSPR